MLCLAMDQASLPSWSAGPPPSLNLTGVADKMLVRAGCDGALLRAFQQALHCNLLWHLLSFVRDLHPDPDLAYLCFFICKPFGMQAHPDCLRPSSAPHPVVNEVVHRRSKSGLLNLRHTRRSSPQVCLLWSKAAPIWLGPIIVISQLPHRSRPAPQPSPRVSRLDCC